MRSRTLYNNHYENKPSRPDFYSRVLLIEDNIGDARLVQLLLEEAESFETEIVNKTSLASGMEAFREAPFDAILLDLTLPDSRGFKTLKTFMSEFPDANVIVLTGLQDKQLGVDAVKEGAQDYLVKGNFDSDWLAKALRYSIERNRVLKRLEEAQRLAHVGHWQYNMMSGEFTASDEVYRILGYQPRSISIDMDEMSCPDSHFHFFSQIIEKARREGAHKSDYTIARNGGGECSVFTQSSISHNSRGEVLSISGIIQDITERKRAEQLQKEFDLTLESAKIKEELLARVSHEMRTPMNGILGMSNLVLKTNLNPKQEDSIRAIRQSSEHLLGIINDILDVSTLQNGEMTFESKPFDLRSLLNNLSNIVHHNQEEKDIVFEMDIAANVPQFMVGDPSRLNQVLINLVGNAFKFTQKGKVRVEVRLIRQEEERYWIKFFVHDTGIGIPKGKLNDIFEPFNRVSHKEKLFEGTGLGLSIARHIVVMQEGGIGVDSELGVGTTFHFEMPFGKTDEVVREDDDDGPVEINTSGEVRLLLAEDHKMNQIVARRTIESEYPNIKITIVENGKDAVEAVRDGDFDLVLMDLHMPVMDGYDAVLNIRNNLPPSKSSITILAMTADAQISQGERYKEHLMDDFVLKPFKPKQLFEKLAFYIHKNNNKG